MLAEGGSQGSTWLAMDSVHPFHATVGKRGVRWAFSNAQARLAPVRSTDCRQDPRERCVAHELSSGVAYRLPAAEPGDPARYSTWSDGPGVCEVADLWTVAPIGRALHVRHHPIVRGRGQAPTVPAPPPRRPGSGQREGTEKPIPHRGRLAMLIAKERLLHGAPRW